MTERSKAIAIRWSGLLLLLGLAAGLLAQENISFQYLYDDVGQLSKVVDSTGIVIEYVYDRSEEHTF